MRGNVLVAIAGLILLPSLFILTALLPEMELPRFSGHVKARMQPSLTLSVR
jgi:hypothetical protein